MSCEHCADAYNEGVEAMMPEVERLRAALFEVRPFVNERLLAIVDTALYTNGTSESWPMKGRRVRSGEGFSFGHLEPGDYGIGPDGKWWLMAPDGARGTIDLTKHSVTEHEDGTITVSPSVVFLAQSNVRPECCDQCKERAHDFGCMWFGFGVERWHGWLERGTWRKV